MAMGLILIVEREHCTVCQQREHWRKWTYEINGKTLIPIIIRYDMKFSFLFWVKFSVKTPIPIIIRKYMKFSFPFWVRFSVLAARKPWIIRGWPNWKSCQFLLQWLHDASKLRVATCSKFRLFNPFYKASVARNTIVYLVFKLMYYRLSLLNHRSDAQIWILNFFYYSESHYVI